MIAACPSCHAKYRVDPAQLAPGGARLRCTKCQAVFRVCAPEPGAKVAAQAAQAPPAPQAVAPSAPASGDSPEPTMDPERIVLVADPDVESGKALCHVLAGHGLQPVLVHDGVEALLTIQRMLPRAVILDAALPKMYGFQVCEMIKRNESLRAIHVALVGSVHHEDHYRNPPSELYGADVYVEKPQILASLEAMLRQFGYDLAGAADASPAPLPPAPQRQTLSPSLPRVEEREPEPAPGPSVAPAAAAPDDGLAQQREAAERLARVIVSDIVLYHPEEFEAGLGSGQLAAALDSALQEGRGFFSQRVDARVRDERDYLMEELLRVARSRGGQ